MEKLSEVIEYAAMRALWKWNAINEFDTVEEAIDYSIALDWGYTLPDCFRPYWFVSHRRSYTEIYTSEPREVIKVSNSSLMKACKSIWDREKSNQLTLF